MEKAIEIPEGYEARIEGNKVILERKESEDERVRKDIIAFLQSMNSHCNPTQDWDLRNRWLPYLERQKEQPTDAKLERVVKAARRVLNNWLDGTDCPDVSGDFAELEYAIRKYDGEEKHREQNLAEDKDAIEPTPKQDYSGLTDLERAIHRGFLCAGVENVSVDIIKDTAQDCLAYIKPAEWGEEDEEMFDAICAIIRMGVPIESSAKAKISWLKSLRPQPKQDVFPSLSEKEIICLKRTLDYLRKEHNHYSGEDFTNEMAVLEWLITHPTLVSDTHWKPSDEDFAELTRIKDSMPNNEWGNQAEGVLDELIENLKKL